MPFIYGSFEHLPLSNNSEIIIQLNASILNAVCKAPGRLALLILRPSPPSGRILLLAMSVCCRYSRNICCWCSFCCCCCWKELQCMRKSLKHSIIIFEMMLSGLLITGWLLVKVSAVAANWNVALPSSPIFSLFILYLSTLCFYVKPRLYIVHPMSPFPVWQLL